MFYLIFMNNVVVFFKPAGNLQCFNKNVEPTTKYNILKNQLWLKPLLCVGITFLPK